jgi:hypothetical protein
MCDRYDGHFAHPETAFRHPASPAQVELATVLFRRLAD